MVEITGGSSQSARGRMPTGLRVCQAKGNKILLENGRWYTDWVMGSHGAIYGYAPDWWVKALSSAAEWGQSASIGCTDERIVAEMIAQFYPDIEAVRFMCTGSDPCAASIKLARAITGRDKLLVYGYHGTNQVFCTPPEVSGTTIDMRRGTLQADRDAFVPLPWDPTEQTFSALNKQIAAVIIEIPSVTGFGDLVIRDWLRSLFSRARDLGVLVILDEVKTGFRYGRSGAAGLYDLHGLVDLYCFGKTLGNGYPISCLAGKKDILKELTNGVHFSGTFFGEPIGLALAKATLRQLMVEQPWEYLYTMGDELMRSWNRSYEAVHLQGHCMRPELSGSKEMIARFVQTYFDYGHIVAQSPWYVTTATTMKDIGDLTCQSL